MLPPPAVSRLVSAQPAFAIVLASFTAVSWCALAIKRSRRPQKGEKNGASALRTAWSGLQQCPPFCASRLAQRFRPAWFLPGRSSEIGANETKQEREPK